MKKQTKRWNNILGGRVCCLTCHVILLTHSLNKILAEIYYFQAHGCILYSLTDETLIESENSASSKTVLPHNPVPVSSEFKL